MLRRKKKASSKTVAKGKSTNKKVRNAQPHVYNGVKYRSKLEVDFAKVFEKHKMKVEYEKKKFVILPSFKFQGKTIHMISYTPDFIYKDKYIIECKGYPTPEFRLKVKMIMQYFLKEGKHEYYVVYNVEELEELIKKIK